MRTVLAVFVSCALVAAAAAEPIDAGRIRVLDGDTIRIDGARPDYRLVGFNTPETRRAKSPEERDLGGKATARLRSIVRAGELDFVEEQCSCKPGTAGTPRCNFGRKCGVLTAAGENVGSILIREGLAVAFTCGPRGCPKMPAPWRR